MTNEACQADSSEASGKATWTWVVPLVFVGSLVAAYAAWPGFRQFIHEAYGALTSDDSGEARAWVQRYGAWGPLVILAGMLIQTLIPIIPSIVLMVVAVLAYGAVWGGALAWGGALVAAMLAYWIGRALSCVTVQKLLGAETQRRVSHAVDCYGVWAVIAARISPVLSTDAVSFVAGLGAMGFWKFLLATALGTLPLAVLIAWLGQDWDRMKGGLIWISVVSLAVVAGYVVYDRRRQRASAGV